MSYDKRLNQLPELYSQYNIIKQLKRHDKLPSKILTEIKSSLAKHFNSARKVVSGIKSQRALATSSLSRDISHLCTKHINKEEDSPWRHGPQEYIFYQQQRLNVTS